MPPKKQLALRKRLGRAVRKLRKDLDISQEELGARASLDRTYISDIERGKRNPSLDIIAGIAKSLKVELSQLFRMTESQ
ncbi:MAG: helix-turn-helix transcriptional regulator [Planctomycetes bacterium]|nr:helix-turn-helix transcriptional regulator [Planctomycetota bacterium]